METGKIKQVLGPVVDVEFPSGELPAIFTALRVSSKAINDKPWNLVLEVAQHLGDRTVRAVSMDSTDGLVRGETVRNTGDMITTPVGKEVLGRIINVIGDPVDEAGPVAAKTQWPIHRPAPRFED